MGIELSIVIPAFNDQAGLDASMPELLAAVRHSGISCEILVIDDGSAPAVAGRVETQGPPIKVLRHRRNLGYGAAIKTGIRAAAGACVLVMDADGQHDPAYIKRFYELAGLHDMAVGMRTSHRTSPLWRRPGKIFLTCLLNSMSETKVSDINCGFRCFRKEAILTSLDLCSDGFSFSLSSTVLMLSRGLDVAFEEVETRERIGTSRVKVRTGFQTIVLIIRLIVLTNPLRFFLPVSLTLFSVGVVWSVPYLMKGHGLSVGGLFLMISGMLTFFFGILADQISALSRRAGA